MVYEAVTRSIRVRVRPQFLDTQSEPDEGRYAWAYTVEIANEGNQTVQLLSRYWRITDEIGRVEEVSGPGVVGETPVLRAGDSFTYTSGCPLRTPSGLMVGTYTMVSDAGERFTVEIPAFSLDSPFVRRPMN
jgi:ApaG protein